MGLRIGIIGLPNVGKSTIFNALTKLQIPAANYPFCTIEPNQGIVLVPDDRLEKIAKVSNPKVLTGDTIEFVDIAGLVPGASTGEGLGNQFLAHIRNMDALAHVVRFFEDEDVVSTTGKIDPLGDVQLIDLELILADLQTIEKRKERTTRLLKSGDPEYKKELKLLAQYEEALEKEIPLRQTDLPQISDLPLLSAKPVLYIANTAEEQADLDHEFMGRVQEENAEVIAISANFEMELSQLEPEEAALFLEGEDSNTSALHRLIEASLKLLDLITFYTIKGDETRSWIIPRGIAAPQAAGSIHSDMERGFIRAEVVKWSDLVEQGSLSTCRDLGLIQIEGKDYKVQDGDVIQFRFNV